MARGQLPFTAHCSPFTGRQSRIVSLERSLRAITRAHERTGRRHEPDYLPSLQKDLIALLRVLDNPRDELAWFRVLTHFRDPVTTQRYFVNKDYVAPDDAQDEMDKLLAGLEGVTRDLSAVADAVRAGWRELRRG